MAVLAEKRSRWVSVAKGRVGVPLATPPARSKHAADRMATGPACTVQATLVQCRSPTCRVPFGGQACTNLLRANRVMWFRSSSVLDVSPIPSRRLGVRAQTAIDLDTVIRRDAHWHPELASHLCDSRYSMHRPDKDVVILVSSPPAVE